MTACTDIIHLPRRVSEKTLVMEAGTVIPINGFAARGRIEKKGS